MFGSLWQRTKKIASTYAYTFITIMFLNQLVFFGFCLNPICLVAAMPHVLLITVILGSWLNKENKWGTKQFEANTTPPNAKKDAERPSVKMPAPNRPTIVPIFVSAERPSVKIPPPNGVPIEDKPHATLTADKEISKQQEIIALFRGIGADRLPSTKKLSDKNIINISTKVMTAFIVAGKQRGEEIPFEHLLTITIKFFGVYETFGAELYSQHLKYEIDKYLKEGLREDYQVNIFKPDIAKSTPSERRVVSSPNDSEKATLNDRELSIKNYASERGIPYIIHFTQAENLPSIMKYGLRSVEKMGATGLKFMNNDRNRWDKRLDGLSVSIGFPNAKMFFKYRKVNMEAEWVVLLINPSVLWSKNCAFFKHNAADSRVRSLSLEELKTNHAFQGMYDDKLLTKSGEVLSRTAQGLDWFETTDVQAEVLIFGTVTPKEIMGVFFENKNIRDIYSSIAGNCPFVVDNKNTGLFSMRGYRKKFNSTEDVPF